MENHLAHLQEFQTILASYRPHLSDSLVKNVRMTLMIGPSATGRDTITKKLIESKDFYYIASDTTRHPRENDGIMETHGVEYWFRSEEEFLADLQEGKLLEAEVIHGQQVSGISLRELHKVNESGRIGITNVELNITHIMALLPNAVGILVLPPSFEEWMKRLNGRGQMNQAEMVRRLKTAAKIFHLGVNNLGRLHIVVNDSLEQSAEEVRELSTADKAHSNSSENTDLLKHLVDETDKWLELNAA